MGVTMKIRFALCLVLLLLGCQGRQPQQQIIFDSKAFFDSAQTAVADGEVYVAGTLTGPGIGYPNNSTAITCYKDRKECFTYSVAQIGPNQIGRLDSPMRFPITKWDAHEVVARGTGDAVECSVVTITIDRKSETALWVTESINQTRVQCRDANTKLLKWTIEDPPAWKAITPK